ncbi:MAG TPA: YkgJ family cysteine cluster protein [Verrucomicrobiae bacterium]|nr:YkgJ family cysteine cluster protein [Verrucomicrobiae bacterium]
MASRWIKTELIQTVMGGENLSTAIAEVRAVYQELARRPVQRNCIARTECCRFQITSQTPHLTKGEALLAAKAFRATGRKELPEAEDGACPMLKRPTGHCMIYADRPFACRTHFCEAAGGPYARKEVVDLIRRLEDLDARLRGDGPRKIESAVADALEEMR